MEAGRLDRKIVIEQKSVQRDAMGGEDITWGTYKTVWAELVAKRRPTETMQSDQLTANRLVDFIIRYQDAPVVDEAMRISYGNSYYEIQGVQEIGRQVGLKLTTKKLV